MLRMGDHNLLARTRWPNSQDWLIMEAIGRGLQWWAKPKKSPFLVWYASASVFCSTQIPHFRITLQPLTASHLHCTAGSSRSFTALRKDAGLCCGSRLLEGRSVCLCWAPSKPKGPKAWALLREKCLHFLREKGSPSMVWTYDARGFRRSIGPSTIVRARRCMKAVLLVAVFTYTQPVVKFIASWLILSYIKMIPLFIKKWYTAPQQHAGKARDLQNPCSQP